MSARPIGKTSFDHGLGTLVHEALPPKSAAKPFTICALEQTRGSGYAQWAAFCCWSPATLFPHRDWQVPEIASRPALREKSAFTRGTMSQTLPHRRLSLSTLPSSRSIERPAVSVIVPAYNTAEFIGETLESVFQQTFQDFEVIVINDGSPDTTKLERVLERFQDQILYLKQENRGLSGARNTGIREARGEYLAFLDSDDSWYPRYLEKQIEYLKQNPSLDAVYCDSRCFGDIRFARQTFMQLCPSNGPVTLESLITGRCHVCVSCTIARHKTVIETGLFDERLRSVEDWDLWIRILHRGGSMTYQRGVLGRRRVRPGALSNDSLKMLASLAQVLRNLDATLNFSVPTRALLLSRLRLTEAHLELEQGKASLALGRLDQAQRYLQAANNFYRSKKIGLVLVVVRRAPPLARLGTKLWSFVLTCLDLCRAAALFAERLVTSPGSEHREDQSDRN
jgi:glycosyltransferase involved in cell wall biosynthesis